MATQKHKFDQVVRAESGEGTVYILGLQSRVEEGRSPRVTVGWPAMSEGAWNTKGTTLSHLNHFREVNVPEIMPHYEGLPSLSEVVKASGKKQAAPEEDEDGDGIVDA